MNITGTLPSYLFLAANFDQRVYIMIDWLSALRMCEKTGTGLLVWLQISGFFNFKLGASASSSHNARQYIHLNAVLVVNLRVDFWYNVKEPNVSAITVGIFLTYVLNLKDK
jgi:hypothetical protein